LCPDFIEASAKRKAFHTFSKSFDLRISTITAALERTIHEEKRRIKRRRDL
jgi:hypothetical protein